MGKQTSLPTLSRTDEQLLEIRAETRTNPYAKLAWLTTTIIVLSCICKKLLSSLFIHVGQLASLGLLVKGLSSHQTVQTITVFDLSKLVWTVGNEALNISVPGSLPSHVHLDLFKARVINDPYFGLNDFNLRWIALNNWTYSAELPLDQKGSRSTWLLFNGLDTFTSIELCGHHVASTNNQFRQYYFDVRNILASCEGVYLLTLNFGSVPAIADEIAAQPGQETWPFGVEGLFEFPNRQFVRKEQSDFGWDWGPAFVPVGPWLPAYVIQLGPSDLYIRNTMVDIYRRGQLPLIPPDQTQPWIMNVSLDVIGSIPPNIDLEYRLTDASNITIMSGSLRNVTLSTESITGTTLVPADAVELWWPNGLGPQTLYSVELVITLGKGVNRLIIASTTKRVGFRTIVLNQEPIRQDQIDRGVAPGNNWHFEINGHEFYAKGSNFIPPDAFWPRVTRARIQQLFDAVITGNQNMLRVWSSGVYSPDFMFEIADELGILLWSEFEFGDALYPVDEDFLNNVREEANFQVRRVNHHPSLALWAGGNELENLELPMVKRIAPDQFERYLAEYEELFLGVLAPCVFENSRSISYTPSSSGNGWQSLNFSTPQPIVQRYDNKTAGCIYGNTDYYQYDSALAFDFSTYPIGRFSNEFGYHSMPSIQSWRQAVAPEDLHFNSSVIQLRNHHYPPGGLNESNFANSTKGMAEMTIAVQRWYPSPNKTDHAANFSSWCHATQIFQADFYKSQIMFYRRGSGMPERQLGSLYWQLEDIWQAPTWAGIEYDGRWKVLHYITKDIYQNIIITPFNDATTGNFEIYVTSDLWSPANGTASFAWYDWSGNVLDIPIPSFVNFSVGAINTTRVFQGNMFDMLGSYDPKDVVLRMEIFADGWLPNNKNAQTFNHVNWFHASPLSQARLVDPGLQIRHQDGFFSVRASRGVAAWVWLDYPEGSVVEFDSNGFWLHAGEERTVGYKLINGHTGDSWAESVTAQSLFDLTLP
ncbi:uncharacterized protein PV09_02872 [Verruconis gallopava]|uniref:Beta-mannosidase A n=1 Tax=Verruconis gallopava TaxID=253628 RepID=A0A0D2B5C3_9PEZI|nr:uncharacterized protein PV09_02872 [Verruconis gallopava]KIW06424.1 hypothetical protein PV09_02872 [Verruconis gallopava]